MSTGNNSDWKVDVASIIKAAHDFCSFFVDLHHKRGVAQLVTTSNCAKATLEYLQTERIIVAPVPPPLAIEMRTMELNLATPLTGDINPRVLARTIHDNHTTVAQLLKEHYQIDITRSIKPSTEWFMYISPHCKDSPPVEIEEMTLEQIIDYHLLFSKMSVDELEKEDLLNKGIQQNFVLHDTHQRNY